MSIDFEDLFNFEEKYGELETEGSSEFGSPTSPSPNSSSLHRQQSFDGTLSSSALSLPPPPSDPLEALTGNSHSSAALYPPPPSPSASSSSHYSHNHHAHHHQHNQSSPYGSPSGHLGTSQGQNIPPPSPSNHNQLGSIVANAANYLPNQQLPPNNLPYYHHPQYSSASIVDMGENSNPYAGQNLQGYSQSPPAVGSSSSFQGQQQPSMHSYFLSSHQSPFPESYHHQSNSMHSLHLHHQAHSALLLIDNTGGSGNGNSSTGAGAGNINNTSSGSAGDLLVNSSSLLLGNLDDSPSSPPLDANSGNSSGAATPIGLYSGLSEEISNASAALSHLHNPQMHHHHKHMIHQKGQYFSQNHASNSGSFYATSPPNASINSSLGGSMMLPPPPHHQQQQQYQQQQYLNTSASIPIGINANSSSFGGYGLPGPHTLIAVSAAHSPSAAGSPLSGSYGTTVNSSNSALKLVSGAGTAAGYQSAGIGGARSGGHISNAYSNSSSGRKKTTSTSTNEQHSIDGFSSAVSLSTNMISSSSLPASSGMQQHPQQYDKINVKRERNRLAAERCRRKKLELIDSLQSENEQLKMELEHLKMELARYRGSLVRNTVEE